MLYILFQKNFIYYQLTRAELIFLYKDNDSGTEAKTMSTLIQQPKTHSKPSILFVDDEPGILKSLTRFGRSKNWSITTANSGDEALTLLDEEAFDVIVSDMRMPGISGTDFLTSAKALCPYSIRVLLTGYSDIKAIEHAINDANIHNYITKPWDEIDLTEIINNGIRYIHSERERRRLEELTNIQNKKLGKLALILDKQIKERTIEIEQAMSLLNRSNQQVQDKFFESLTVINHVLEWKNGGDSEHCRFVATYGEKIAHKLSLTDDAIQNIKVAAMLHNIGMLNISDEIRAKPIYRLNIEQANVYKKIPIFGELALSSAPSMQKVAKIIRHQQEHVNGNGYPDGLIDKEIPIESKIIAITADFYNTFNGRLVQNSFGFKHAKTFIEKWKGKKYDSAIVDIFWEVLGDYSINAVNSIPIYSVDLVKGMILESDIITKKGILLITKGTELTDSIIEKICIHEQSYYEEFVIKIQP